MSYSRPSVFPEWATTLSNDGPLGGPNRVEPSGGDKATGFTYPQQAPREWFNWLLYTNYQWLAYLDQQITAGGNSVFAHDVTNDSGLDFAYIGGAFYDQYAKTLTTVSSGTVTLTNNTTNFVVYRSGTGVVNVVNPFNTNATKGDVPLWKVVTSSGSITTVTDLRNPASHILPYFTATDKILGRSSSGAGYAEEITCTAAARSLLDDATLADMRNTLGVLSVGLYTDSGLTLNTSRVIGRSTSGVGAGEELEPEGGISIRSGKLLVGGDYARPNKRQTVLQASVDSNGFPNFITAGSGLAVNIAATAVPVVLTAANGCGLYGNRDRINAIVADISITGLADNATNYLYATLNSDGSVTLGTSSESPVYQFGGSYSNTLNKFVFNIAEMKGHVGDGSGNAQEYRVYIGEAVTSSGSVTSVVNYALMGRYQSANTSLTGSPATLYTFSHNIGVQKVTSNVMLVNTTEDANYSVGDMVEPQAYYASSDTAQPSIRLSNRNTLSCRSGGVGVNGWVIPNATSAAPNQPTTTSWNLFVTAERGW